MGLSSGILEEIFERELNLAVVVDGAGDGTKGRVAMELVGVGELGVVEDVEEL